MSAAIPRSVCVGPIDTHVVRPEFTCHHCSWTLRADVGIAFQRAIVVGVAVALTTLALTSSHPYTLTTPTQTNPPIWASFQVFNTIMNKRKHVESALTLWDRIVYGGIATMFGLTIGCGSAVLRFWLYSPPVTSVGTSYDSRQSSSFWLGLCAVRSWVILSAMR